MISGAKRIFPNLRVAICGTLSRLHCTDTGGLVEGLKHTGKEVGIAHNCRPGGLLLRTPHHNDDVLFWIHIDTLAENAKCPKRSLRFAPPHIPVRNKLVADLFWLPGVRKPTARNHLLCSSHSTLQHELSKPAVVS
jgi:hypothetical protein